MILLVFTVFLVVSLCSELFLRRNIAERYHKSRALTIYTATTISIWVIMLITICLAITLNTPAAVLMKAAGIVIFVFLLNGVSKILLTLAILIGRATNRQRLSNITGVVLVVTFNCFLIISALICTSNLRLEKREIRSPKITADLDGFRIVVVSDMHTGLLLNKHGMVTNIVDEINLLNPDVVINCGDIVNHDYSELDTQTLEILSGIKSRYGVYSVLGNHDMGIYIRDTTYLNATNNIAELSRRQRSLGWHLLRNESETIAVEGDSITITGINYPDELVHKSHQRLSNTKDLSQAYAGIDTTKFNITISHAPQTWDNILATGIGDLTLSGHVHSLQMKLKVGKGRGWSPAVFFYDRWSGMYSEEGRHLYINDGIGYAMMPVRIGVKPEITLIELNQ